MIFARFISRVALNGCVQRQQVIGTAVKNCLKNVFCQYVKHSALYDAILSGVNQSSWARIVAQKLCRIFKSAAGSVRQRDWLVNTPKGNSGALQLNGFKF